MDGLEQHFAATLSKGWRYFLLRGLVAIAFGILTWMRPAISLAAFILLFGLYALFDGIFNVMVAFVGRKGEQTWWVVLLEGLLGIGVVLITLTTRRITAVVLLFYIAILLIGRGFLEIIAAIRLRKEVQGEWLLVLAGLVSVLFGALLMARPGIGAVALAWLIAAYAVALGVVFVILAFK